MFRCPLRPDQLWMEDFTYVPMTAGFGYTAVVIDDFNDMPPLPGKHPCWSTYPTYPTMITGAGCGENLHAQFGKRLTEKDLVKGASPAVEFRSMRRELETESSAIAPASIPISGESRTPYILFLWSTFQEIKFQ